jgi:hypothetical protein
MRRNIILALLGALFAGSPTSYAAEPPPHPGEPADHRTLQPGAKGTPARMYAREHPEGPPRVEPVYVKPARTDHWELTLPKCHPTGADAVLTVAVRDGAVVNGYTRK